MKKRLFITTGLISLLNALTIIKMQGECCEDHLLIYSFVLSDKFREEHRFLIDHHDFKEIYFSTHWNNVDIDFDIFDEVYAVERIALEDTTCFVGKRIFYFDEGVIYLNQSLNNIKNPDGTFYWNYLHKIVPFDTEKNTVPDTDVFRALSDALIRENIPIHTPYRKRALLLGQLLWSELYRHDEKIAYYKKIIMDLRNKDFDIYLKPHPREDMNFYNELIMSFPEGLYILETTLPIEVYDADFTIAIAAMSTSLFSLAHFRHIPTGNAVTEKFFNSNIPLSAIQYSFLVLEYIPDYTYLLDFIEPSMTHEVALDILKARFSAYVSDKTASNTNELVKKVMRSKIVSSKIKNIYIKIRSAFIFNSTKKNNLRKRLQLGPVYLYDSLTGEKYPASKLWKKRIIKE